MTNEPAKFRWVRPRVWWYAHWLLVEWCFGVMISTIGVTVAIGPFDIMFEWAERYYD